MITDNPEFFNIEQQKQIGLWPLTFLPAYGMISYINRMRGDVIGAEIGVLKGETSHVLLESCPNIKKLYGIDPYITYTAIDVVRTQEDMNSYEKTLHQNMSPFGERFELIKKKSVDATDQLANESLDFVLVDGDQTEDSIHNDIELYYPKIKKNGYIFGHDIQVKFVVDAIKLYRETNRIRTPLNNSKNFVWFWIKP